MPMTMLQLRDQLSAIESDESTYTGINAEDVPLLQDLLNDGEGWLAARAVHALSRIDADDARDALLVAAQHARPEVRVAVASSAGALRPDVSDEVLTRLLGDSEIGVRKFAIKSATELNSNAVILRVADIAATDSDLTLRQIAEEKVKSASPS